MRAADSYEQAVGPFFSRHCTGCHGKDKQKGEFRLDILSRDFANGKDVAMWVRHVNKCNSTDKRPNILLLQADDFARATISAKRMYSAS